MSECRCQIFFVFNVAKLIGVCCLGWLFKIEMKNMDDLKGLMDEKRYEAYLKEDHEDEEYQPI